MGPLRIALLPGDGIGPEVVDAARQVLLATGLSFDFDVIPCGGAYYLEHGEDWPVDGQARCRAAEAILLGAVGWPHPDGTGPVLRSDGEMAGHSAVLGNRRELDLYANVRPIRVLPGIRQRLAGRHQTAYRPSEVDLVIIRENTEGLYIGAGAVHRPGGRAEAGVDTRLLTRAGVERVCRKAFEVAQHRSGAPQDGMKRVTAVAKHNVLASCRFFVDVFDEVGQAFPDVTTEVVLVDAFSQFLLTEPSRFDVVVTTNLFGDILTDQAAVLQGGMGMAMGANLGEDHAMFEPIHGSAPDLAGHGRANPLATILAAAELLGWVGRRRWEPAIETAGFRIKDAVAKVTAEGECLTEDLVGSERARSTIEVADAVVERLETA